MSQIIIPDRTLERLRQIAQATGRDAETLAAEALDVFVSEERDWLEYARREAADGFAALDRGEGVRSTPDEFIARLERDARALVAVRQSK
jgi:predicted transcriptional regulator